MHYNGLLLCIALRRSKMPFFDVLSVCPYSYIAHSAGGVLYAILGGYTIMVFNRLYIRLPLVLWCAYCILLVDKMNDIQIVNL